VAAGGEGLNLTLTCASDSYKFNLKADVVSARGALTGSWSESSRNVAGTLEGRGVNGEFKVVASAAGFSANISLSTRGNKQSVVMRADSVFKGANISLTKQ